MMYDTFNKGSAINEAVQVTVLDFMFQLAEIEHGCNFVSLSPFPALEKLCKRELWK